MAVYSERVPSRPVETVSALARNSAWGAVSRGSGTRRVRKRFLHAMRLGRPCCEPDVEAALRLHNPVTQFFVQTDGAVVGAEHV